MARPGRPVGPIPAIAILAARPVALGAHLILLIALPAWMASRLGLALALPLLLPLRGLWRGRRYTAAWSTMLIAFYAAGLLAQGYAQAEGRSIAFALAAAAAVEFVALLVLVRLPDRSAPVARTAP